MPAPMRVRVPARAKVALTGPGSVPRAVIARVAWLAAVMCAALLVMGVTGAHAQGAGGRPPVPQTDWRGTGVVMAILPPPSSLHETRPVIVIDHEPIAGLMSEKMSMPFIAASTDLFGDLKVGDRIAFGLKDTPGALLVVTIERLPARR